MDSRSAFAFRVTLFLATAAVGWLYLLTQPQITLHAGRPWDAGFYYEMARQAADGQAIVCRAPFVYRPAIPLLVARLFAADLALGFRAVNIVFSHCALWLLIALLCRLLTRRTVIAVLALWFVANPNGPFRVTAFYPVFTDQAALCVSLALLLLGVCSPLTLRRALLMAALAAVGVTVRETTLIPVLAVLAGSALRWKPGRRWPEVVPNRETALAVLPLAAGLVAIVASRRWVTAAGPYTFASHAVDATLRNLSNPTIHVLALLLAYGPLLFGLALQPRQAAAAARAQPLLAVFLLGVLALSVFAGTHTDRFLFWGAPAVLYFVGVAVESALDQGWPARRSLWLAAVGLPLLIAQLLSFRALTVIPDAKHDLHERLPRPEVLVFSAYGRNAEFRHTVSAFADRRTRAVLAAEYAAFAGYLAVVVTWLRGSSQTRGPTLVGSEAPRRPRGRSGFRAPVVLRASRGRCRPTRLALPGR